jgi:fatty acid synthase, animal type
LTVALGQALLDAGLDLCYVEYICTDTSEARSQAAASKSPWPSVFPLTFDLNKPCEPQGIDPQSFDIVIASDISRMCPDIPVTLKALYQLLLPGGHLAVIEIDRSMRFTGSICTSYFMVKSPTLTLDLRDELHFRHEQSVHAIGLGSRVEIF